MGALFGRRRSHIHLARMLRVTTPGVEDMGKFISAVAIAVSLGGIGSASAQPYPLRPITLGMPFAGGGPGDTLARIADPAVRSRLADLGHEFFPRDQLTPEALAAFQAAEIKKWWPIIKAANIKGE